MLASVCVKSDDVQDPEGLFQILRTFPYHADTLLQLSEVYHHREGLISHLLVPQILIDSRPIPQNTAPRRSSLIVQCSHMNVHLLVLSTSRVG